MNQTTDFGVHDLGTIVLLYALSDAAKDWVSENITDDGITYWGKAIAIDHGCAQTIIDGIEHDALTVTTRVEVLH
jgi:hypothetical protein